jgi:hypothetical protein
MAGYDALVINRIDHTVKTALKEKGGGLEFIWKPYAESPALPPTLHDSDGASGSGPILDGSLRDPAHSRLLPYSNASIFTHVLHSHYSAPKGFDFENPEGVAVRDHNVAKRAGVLAREVLSRADAYRTSHLLVPFGDDFKFRNAAHQFQNMDALVTYFAQHNGLGGGDGGERVDGVEGIELRYSTLSEYFTAVWRESWGSEEVEPAPVEPATPAAAAAPFSAAAPEAQSAAAPPVVAAAAAAEAAAAAVAVGKNVTAEALPATLQKGMADGASSKDKGADVAAGAAEKQLDPAPADPAPAKAVADAVAETEGAAAVPAEGKVKGKKGKGKREKVRAGRKLLGAAPDQEQAAPLVASVLASGPSAEPRIVFPVFGPESKVDGGVDFFPYADNERSWWVGYYTSRPLLKQLIRRATMTLRGADALTALVRPWAHLWQTAALTLAEEDEASTQTFLATRTAADSTEGVEEKAATETDDAPALRDVRRSLLAASSDPYARVDWLSLFQRLEQGRLDAALCLHHDAITGTSRQDVVDDYTQRMVSAITGGYEVISDLASLVLGGLPRALRHSVDPATGVPVSPVKGTKASSSSSTFLSDLTSGIEGDTDFGPAPLTHAAHVLPLADSLIVEAHRPDAGNDVHDRRPRSLRKRSGGGPNAAVAVSGDEAEAPAADALPLYSTPTVVLTPSSEAHPVVVFNPTAWRRKSVVTVMVDLGNEIASALIAEGDGKTDEAKQRLLCKLNRWPIAVVADDSGRVIPSQWHASLESDALAKEIKSALDGNNAFALADSSNNGNARVSDLHFAQAGAVPSVVRTGIRYEIAFPAEVPAFGLATYFVSVSWKITDATAATSVDACAATEAAPETMKDLLSVSAASASLAVVLSKGPSEREETEPLGDAASGPRLSAWVADTGASAEPIILENACLAVEINPLTGLLQAITSKHPSNSLGEKRDGFRPGPIRVPVQQEYARTTTTDSGAYLYRPSQRIVLSQSAGESDEVTVTVSKSAQRSLHGGDGLLQTVRVVGPTYSQTIRLSDTLGWNHRQKQGKKAGDNIVDYATVCSDPLVADAAIDFRPTVHAGGNEEILVRLATGIDVTGKSGWKDAEELSKGSSYWSSNDGTSTNPRNYLDHKALPKRPTSGNSSAATNGGSSVSVQCPAASAPYGWWTGDGLGLVRRAASPSTIRVDETPRHMYPLNTLGRMSGPLSWATRRKDDSSLLNQEAAVPHAWLTLYTAQPFGARVGETNTQGSELDVMLHRHLIQDDGRGLATGVNDNTFLTARFSITLGAEWSKPCSVDASIKKPASDAAPPSPATTAHELGRGAGHEDWLWAWATRAAVHHEPLLVLHADLADIRSSDRFAQVLEAALGTAEDPEAAPVGHVRSSVEETAVKEVVVPPRDSSTHLTDSAAISAEPPVPRSLWLSRYSTRLDPVGANAWALQEAPREDSYAAAIEETCSQPDGLSDFPQVCHHVLAHGNSKLASAAALSDASGGFPPWLHVMTLQVRDAVSDDVILRLQNFGGPSSMVDVSSLFAADDATPLSIASLVPRSLTLNHYEDFVNSDHVHPPSQKTTVYEAFGTQLSFPHPQNSRFSARFPVAHSSLFSILGALSSQVQQETISFMELSGASEAGPIRAASFGLKWASSFVAPHSGQAKKQTGYSKQNTEEEGVFLSDAALKKKKEDEERRKQQVVRKLLSASEGDGNANSGEEDINRHLVDADDLKHPVLLPPTTLRSFAAALEPQRNVMRRLVSRMDVATFDAAKKLQKLSAASPADGKKLSTEAMDPKQKKPVPANAKAGKVAEADLEDAKVSAEQRGSSMEVATSSATVQAQDEEAPMTNEERADLVGRIKILVLDSELRRQMLSRMEKHKPLTRTQRSILRKLERKPGRVHDQPPPPDLEDRIQKAMDAKARKRQGAPALPKAVPVPLPVPEIEDSVEGKEPIDPLLAENNDINGDGEAAKVQLIAPNAQPVPEAEVANEDQQPEKKAAPEFDPFAVPEENGAAPVQPRVPAPEGDNVMDPVAAAPRNPAARKKDIPRRAPGDVKPALPQDPWANEVDIKKARNGKKKDNKIKEAAKADHAVAGLFESLEDADGDEAPEGVLRFASVDLSEPTDDLFVIYLAITVIAVGIMFLVGLRILSRPARTISGTQAGAGILPLRGGMTGGDGHAFSLSSLWRRLTNNRMAIKNL